MIAMPWAKIVDIPFWQFQHWTLFHDKGAFPVRTALLHDAPHHLVSFTIDLTLMELNRCTNFHVASSKYIEIRGHSVCTCIARALCTTTPQVMHHRKVLVELYQCTKFRVASSKFPVGEGACANTQCTCIARALCTPSPRGMHHRITLIELHQCTKFGVDS